LIYVTPSSDPVMRGERRTYFCDPYIHEKGTEQEHLARACRGELRRPWLPASSPRRKPNSAHPPLSRIVEKPTSYGIRHLFWMAHSHHRENNDSYRLYRANPNGPVSVFNQDGFLMAEYDPATGTTAWHRVVPATKRESVEKKLSEQFPVVTVRTAAFKKSRRRRQQG
jgi:hypothetical protein